MADFDIESLLNSLSAEDVENIKKAAAGIFGNTDHAKEETHTQNKAGKSTVQSDTFAGLGLPDLSVLSSLAPVLQAFNSHDERVDFINALKPLLSQERRQKADEAMKLVKLLSVLPLLRERGIM